MSDSQAQNAQPQTNAPRSKLFRSTAIVTAIVLVILGLLWAGGVLSGRSAEQKLAAIEAARAIPDEENAAVIYTKLATTLDVPAVNRTFTNLVMSTVGSTVYTRPWPSSRYPQLADFIENQQDVLSTLKRASIKEKCRFSIGLEPNRFPQLARVFWSMRLWQNLLVVAANNDIAEGRIEEAVEKYLCLIRMARHLYQKPVFHQFNVGFGFETSALTNLGRLVIQENLSQDDLNIIDEALSQIPYDYAGDWAAVGEVMQLYDEYQIEKMGLWGRLRLHFANLTSRGRPMTFLDGVHASFRQDYHRVCALRYGTRVLIALRRYRDQHGNWPKSLDEIKTVTPAEIFVDPMTDKEFVYSVSNEDFRLYSVGLNKVDEDGRRDPEFIALGLDMRDDIPVWSVNPVEHTEDFDDFRW